MASLRKAGAYSKKYARPYTRVSRKRTKNYIKSTSQSKLVKFNMGDTKGHQAKKYDTLIRVIAKERIQIRDNAIEAARQSVHRKLDKNIQGQYYLEIRVFPHHILRENKMLTGAGSDRMQTGMQKSFGKTIGRAALVKENQEIITVETTGDKQIRLVKQVLKAIKAKLPCKTDIKVEKIK
jgi:large subunit ribosomal protein L10e